MEDEKRTIKKPSLAIALIPVVFLIVFLMVTIIVFEGDPHIPLIFGAVVASCIGIYLGWKWDEIEEYIIKTISMSMQACLILMIIGLLIAVWIMSGTVPAMIYYGLMILNPKIFLFVAAIMCSIVSLATGSSWTTAGTVGVALIGIGTGLGIPAAMCAGAIVSGAYFGDKMSPLSDTTNLAPAMAGTTLFEHIRHMIYTTGPSLVIALVLYLVLGFRFGDNAMDTAQIDGIIEAIHSAFNINIFLLIPPLLVIAMVVLKVPAIPGLVGGILLGCIFYFIFQMGGTPLAEAGASVVDVLNYGYVSETGHELVDELLSRGGLQEMMWTISLIISAMSFGGVMERTGCLETIANTLLRFAKGTGGLVAVTIFSCFFINVVAGDQYLSIVIPGRMYKDEFRKRGLHPKNLSRCLEDCGTITSCLIPWNTCGAFMYSALGVHPFQYLPYAFLNVINPFVSIFYGFTGITMEKLPPEELAKVAEEQKAAAALAGSVQA